MKKFNFGKIFTMMAAAVAVFGLAVAGCENINLGDGNASGLGVLRLNVSDSLSQSKLKKAVSASARGIMLTVNPSDSMVTYWDKYVLSFVENSGGNAPADIEVVTETDNRLSGNIITVSVAAGDYTVTITAYKEGVAAAKGTVEVDVKAGQAAPEQPVAILPKTQTEDATLANGTLSYSIGLAGLTGLTKKQLYFTNGVSADKVHVDGFDSGVKTLTENTMNSGTASLPPGLYKAYIELEKDGEVAGLYGDIVYIYSAQTSTLPAITFTSANFSPGSGSQAEGELEGELQFAGTINVIGWPEEGDFTISKEASPVTFTIASSYTDITWMLNNESLGSATSVQLNPASLDAKTYTLLVTAKNGSGQWESSGGLSVTITEEAEEENNIPEWDLGLKHGPFQIEDIKEWLEEQAINSAETYYTIQLDSSVAKPADYSALRTAFIHNDEKKYVALDLSLVNWGSTLIGKAAGIPLTGSTKGNFNYIYSTNVNLVGVILPKGLNGSIYGICYGIKTMTWITIPDDNIITNYADAFSTASSSASSTTTTITKITMGKNVTLTGNAITQNPFGQNFNNTFYNSYIQSGAGTYNYTGNAWVKED